ncbi:MAG TPA: hypothetical protein VMZ53_30510 [Kofleriaceae bacterium]|nr:hypothetical protein [Kofleriaceae bacterium]
MIRYLALAAVCAACSRTPAPKDPTERALFRDLERDVTVTETTGWGIDRIEIESMLERALDSVCRVDELGRRGLHEWLDAQIAESGGPVDEAWRKRGKRLSNVKGLLVLHRVRMLLERAQESSADCPFWLEPENPFRGRQISEHRWSLTFGGGGIGSAIAQGDRTDISAGGAGRLLIGRMFANGDGLYLGAEVAGSAQFPKDAMGDRTSLQLGVDLVSLLVYRHTLTNTYFEAEGGWLGHSTEEDWGAIDNGMHVGVSFGGRALRQRFLFPGAALTFAWERLFLPGDDLITLKVGARVAFDWDL